jgi:hypothetical protein
MEQQDKRMNLTTETFTNIKTAKLYSWTDILIKMIDERRKNELGVLKKKLVAETFMLAGFYFFPQLL